MLTSDSPDQPGERAYLTLRGKAYRLLARREHSAWELRRKLQSAHSKEYPMMVDRLMAELAGQGAQSDFRFTEQLCRSRYQNGRGPVKLRHELAQHHIEESMIDQVLSGYDAKWRDLASEVRRKKFGESSPASFKEWARQARFLQQRGFDADQIEPYTE